MRNSVAAPINNAWELWADLRARFGNPRLAGAGSERLAAIRERRGLRIERTSDGFGSGSVTVERLSDAAPPEGDRWTSSVDIYFDSPAVVTDEELEILKANQWESWNDLPGIP